MTIDQDVRRILAAVVADGPDSGPDVDAVVRAGRHQLRRRRAIQVGAALAAASCCVGLLAVARPMSAGTSSDGERGQSLQPIATAPGPAESGFAPSPLPPPPTGPPIAPPMLPPPPPRDPTTEEFTAPFDGQLATMYDTIVANSPESFVLDLRGHSSDHGASLHGNVDDGAGPAALMITVYLRPGALDLRPCADPGDYPLGVSCLESRQADRTRLFTIERTTYHGSVTMTAPDQLAVHRLSS